MLEYGRLSEEAQNIYNDIYQAYVFTFPFVQSMIYGRYQTNVERPEKLRSPYNQFAHRKSLWHAREHLHGGINMDVMYSIATLNLKEDAIVYHKPKTDRFYSFQAADAFGNQTALIGSGGIGGRAEGYYAFTGPGFQGALPDDVVQIKVPTNHAAVLLRIQLRNAADLEQVKSLQEQSTLIPLAYHGKDYVLPKGHHEEKYDYVFYGEIEKTGIEEYFEIYNQSVGENPPTGEDKEEAEKYVKYGIGEKQTFSLSQFTEEGLVEKLREIPHVLAEAFEKRKKSETPFERNKWMFIFNVTARDYFERAYSYQWGPVPNPPEAVIYATTDEDRDGNKIKNSEKYVIHFERSQIPMLKEDGYWSISAYTRSGLYLMDNEIDRYHVGSESGLSYNADGSVDIYVQKDRPEERKVNNWLPLGEEEALLFLRIYMPSESILEGVWKPPFVEKNS